MQQSVEAMDARLTEIKVLLKRPVSDDSMLVEHARLKQEFDDLFEVLIARLGYIAD